MSRTTLLLLAVLVLGGVSYLALSGEDAGAKLSEGAAERQFAYSEVEDIHRIYIADRKGHTTNLTRGGVSGWMVEDKPANENIMKNLLAVAARLEVQSLPAYKAIPNMIESIASHGILVQLFDKEGTKLRGYYIGGATNDNTGNYAIKEGSENPYIVHIPGFTGSVRARINHWDDEWRDKVYWRVDPEQVELFSIEYPRQRNKSFVLERKGEDFQLRPFYETGQQTRMVPYQGIEGALAKYERFYVNRYENRDTESIAEAKEQIPFARITIQETGKEAQTMVVYPKYDENTFVTDPKTGDVIQNGGLIAYRGFINDGEDWVLLNVETLQPLLVNYDVF